MALSQKLTTYVINTDTNTNEYTITNTNTNTNVKQFPHVKQFPLVGWFGCLLGCLVVWLVGCLIHWLAVGWLAVWLALLG